MLSRHEHYVEPEYLKTPDHLQTKMRSMTSFILVILIQKS